MSEKIDKTLKKIAAATSKASTPTTSNTDLPGRRDVLLHGDPDCPKCQGVGYLRQDLPVGHPDFGMLSICSCRHNEVSQQVHERLFAHSNLSELTHLTFENFEHRGHIGIPTQQAASLENAYNQALHYAQHLNGWLLVQGKYGCGKTHLAAAIANFTVSIGVPTLFITVPDLLDSLRNTYQVPDITFEEQFNEVRQIPFLILDDFGTQNATSWAQEKLFQIINYRYINQLPLVVTTNLGLDQIDERISSRLQDPELVSLIRILAPDYRRPLDDIGHPELSTLMHLHDRSFANLDLRKKESLSQEELQSLEKVFDAARGFADQPKGWLVLTGPYGCGKTHLAAAIANYRTDMETPPLFVVVPDLLDHLRATFNPASPVSLDRRFEEVRKAALLVLDDLGTQSMTPWVREKLYQLINYRYNNKLPTVITTADTLDEIDPRIRSRMLDRRLCTIYAITVPSYQGAPSPSSRNPSK